MLLSKTVKTVILTSLFASLASASAGGLRAGEYSFSKGSKGAEEVCADITISATNIQDGRIHLGHPQHVFTVENSDSPWVRDELDPKCESNVKSRHLETDGQTVLEMSLTMSCAGKADDIQAFKATLEAKKITLLATDQFGVRYTCEWKRK